MRRGKLFLFALAISLMAAGCGDQSDSAGDSEKTASNQAQFKLNAKITEQTIYDQGGFVLKALSLEVKDDNEAAGTAQADEAKSTAAQTDASPENNSGPYLALNIYEENQGDRTLTAKYYAVAVNGVTVHNYDAVGWCEPGCGGESYFILGDLDLLNAAGIEDVAEISFQFYLSDADTWEIVDSQIITIKTDRFDSIQQEKPAATGDVLYAENDIKITSAGFDQKAVSGDGSATLAPRFYVENNSDRYIDLSVDSDLVINGIDLYHYPSLTIGYLLPGTCAYTDLCLDDSTLAEAGVSGGEDLKSLAFTFIVSDKYVSDTLDLEGAVLYKAPVTVSYP